MIRGLYTATSGMLVEQTRQDVISNNLANVDTAGFKRDLAIFRDWPDMDIHRIDDNRKIFGKELEIDFRPYIGKIGTGACVDEIVTIQEQGKMQLTGNKTDFGIFGKGFFVVETEDGPMLTRAGNFRVGPGGFLTDAGGRRVMALKEPAVMNQGNVVMDEKGNYAMNASYIPVDNINNFAVTEDGGVYIDGTLQYKLMIVDYDDTRYLRKIGDSLYKVDDEKAGSGRLAENIQVEQGMLEKANVNIVREMVEMITVMRAYESNQKAIQTHDSTLGKLISTVGAR